MTLIVILLLFALIFARVPIGMAMLIAGFVGLASIAGFQPALSVASHTIYATGTNYSLAALPLYVLLGNLINHAGFGEQLYKASNAFIGHYRGGLAMGTILSCGGLSAVSGSSLATAATMAKIAMPSMRAMGYSDRLAASSVAAGGTLGILIPPSIVLVLYGILTETDIGLLFIAGILPGLLGIACYVGAVYFTTLFFPALGPPGRRHTFQERLSSLKDVWPVVLLFTGIIGGIYAGLFTASEAAAVGVILTLLLGVAMRLLDFYGVISAIVETGRTTAALFLVIIGTTLLTDYANISGAGRAISDFVAYYELTGWRLIWSFVFVCVILGIVIEGVSMIILVIPLFFPIIAAQGIDPIWFGIIFVTITEISFIVPPLGLNLFVLKATIPDIDMRELYKGILPFIVADFVRIAMLIAFPIIALLLPSLMTK